MMTPADQKQADQKRAAALAAVSEIRDGMLVGLGTGSTVAFLIAALGARCAQGLTITAVATSLRTEAAASAAGIDVVDFAPLDHVDLCIDGVDEIDLQFRAIKGGGGAMLREKIIAASATRMIAIADASKAVAQLGTAPVPVEVLPFARGHVARAIAQLGGRPALRVDAAGAPVSTDQGNVILDCGFGLIDQPTALADRLSNIAGIMGHGLFIDEIDALYWGTADGVVMTVRTLF
ncbi:ribose-5-phosphate isomerase RpiA [soil metagenome]